MAYAKIFYEENLSLTDSESSETFAEDSTDSETSFEEQAINGTGVEQLSHLEQKMDRLRDLLLEQCRILSGIKVEIMNSRDAIEESGDECSQLYAQLAHFNSINDSKGLEKEKVSDAEPINSRARSLLDAIEVKQTRAKVAHTTPAPSKHMQVAIEKLLQNDIQSHNINGLFFDDELQSTVEDQCSHASRYMYRATRQLRHALDQQQDALHRSLPSHSLLYSLQRTSDRISDSERKLWRQKIMQTMSTAAPSADSPPLTPTSPVSPEQSADTENSIIDQLMEAAVINKQLEEGDVNGSFERALSAMDLSLVVGACRAAEPARVFSPCRLRQPVLLALVQQLTTDMLSDTQLKCRYLEEAIISIDTSNPETRAHLPVVVGEVRKHLLKFLALYPNHVASRRITLIVMAAVNLLK